jgi:hypothetical protein
VPVDALIAVFPDADPADIDIYRSAAAAGIDRATAGVEDPDCDLDAAKDRLR